ncbi:MAG: energy transducer TonB, partial [Bdellovibrionota bacterium]
QKEIEKLKSQVAETSLVEKAEKAKDDAFLGLQTQVVDQQTRAQNTAAFRDGKHKGGDRGRSNKAQEKVEIGTLGVKMNYKPMGGVGPGEIAATNDYLKDVKPGAQTMLNTKEFAYFSFYQRVRRQLEQYWEPGLRERLRSMFAKGRQLAADREHATRILVVMDHEGTITKIQVEGTSGLLDLDQAAVDAFNRAGPFPNPPKGMIESDGTVKVEWEFVLKT